MELSHHFDDHANQNKQWKDHFLEAAKGVFRDEVKGEPAGQIVDVIALHAEFGELTLENDCSFGGLVKAGLLG